MNMLVLGALIAGLVGTAVQGQSSFTGNDLIADCVTENPARELACLGYVMGAVDGFRNGAALVENYPDYLKICVPNGVTQGQIRDVVITHIRQNPENRHLPASALVFTALNSTFFCE